MQEIYKDIPNYEGIYQISNFGNVRSLRFNKIKLLKPLIGRNGYLNINLYFNKKLKTYNIHQLVAMTFLNHNPKGHKIVVNHIDNNQLNNRIDNLELVSNRYNSSCHKTDVGISWRKLNNKWQSRIIINKKEIHLGLFSNKEKAIKIYEIALNNINLFNGNNKEFKSLINELYSSIYSQ